MQERETENNKRRYHKSDLEVVVSSQQRGEYGTKDRAQPEAASVDS